MRGLVLAAALSAMMSTASGALIASSTVLTSDIIPRLKDLFVPGHKESQAQEAAASPTGHPEGAGVTGYRIATLLLGVVVIIIASLVTSVVGALAIAYNILVGGLFVSILGGLIWKRGTRSGALASILVGTVAVIIAMVATDILANEPIYFGLGSSLITFVVVSLLTRPTDGVIMEEWTRRLKISDRTEVNDIVNIKV